MHTMGSNPQKLTNITNPAKKTSIETPGVAPNHHHLGCEFPTLRFFGHNEMMPGKHPDGNCESPHESH